MRSQRPYHTFEQSPLFSLTGACLFSEALFMSSFKEKLVPYSTSFHFWLRLLLPYSYSCVAYHHVQGRFTLGRF